MIESVRNSIIIDRILQTTPEVWSIYRFGSAGTPFERSDSDIDLAILSYKPLSSLACWELAQDLARRLGRDVDLVDLRSASTVLRQQVFQQGQRIYCADHFLADEFESRALSDYVHLNEARRDILKDIIDERRRIYA